MTSAGGLHRGISCRLMGRATNDAIAAMDVPWPHQERDTIVATRRALSQPPPRVEPARGTIEELISMAKARAGSRDVDLDGGDLIRQALDGSLSDPSCAWWSGEGVSEDSSS